MVLEWDKEKAELEAILYESMGTKSRTIQSYALIGMAVKYIYEHNKRIFLELGHPWEEMVHEFLPGKFRDAVRLSHPDISRPDLLLKNFLVKLGRHATQLTMSQVISLCSIELLSQVYTHFSSTCMRETTHEGMCKIYLKIIFSEETKVMPGRNLKNRY